ncbi:formylglycine-generating enzyme family protein [archaeon]|nr:formylglycine-generating enzyme family protein [archaeon]
MIVWIPPSLIPQLSKEPGVVRIILPNTGVPEKPENPIPLVPINNDIISEIEFVLIPAGEFDMGTNETEGPLSRSSRPIHHVKITKPFYMGKYEVTQKQWGAIMGYNPSFFEVCEECPVDSVSWSEIQEFIAKLNEIEDTDKYRLPTEAEWEYAARAGTRTPYSFENESKIDEYVWYGRNTYQRSQPVGILKPNPWGLYDIHGNIGEYVNDYYGDYPEEDAVDPKGPSNGPGYVTRGCHYTNSAWICRSDFRHYYPDETFDLGTGFRLAKSQ